MMPRNFSSSGTFIFSVMLLASCGGNHPKPSPDNAGTGGGTTGKTPIVKEIKSGLAGKISLSKKSSNYESLIYSQKDTEAAIDKLMAEGITPEKFAKLFRFC